MTIKVQNLSDLQDRRIMMETLGIRAVAGLGIY